MLNQMMNSANTTVAVTQQLASAQTKDTQWLTLEVCREFQRNKCTRSDTECKYAHPPPHVEVQNGRVTACFDSIKGKCQRKEPPCKYLHPPQHLKEVLLQNGRRNLILKNSMISPYLNMPAYVPGYTPIMYDTLGGKTMAYHGGMIQAQAPYMAHPYFATQSPQLVPWQHYINSVYQNVPMQLQPVTDNNAAMLAQQLPAACTPQPILTTTQTPTSLPKATRQERLEPPVVEVIAGKKRPRDPADDLVLNSIPGMVPITKRMALPDNKGGVPMYQPAMTMSAYQHALAMQLGQAQYIPAVSATATYVPHPPNLSRF